MADAIVICLPSLGKRPLSDLKNEGPTGPLEDAANADRPLTRKGEAMEQAVAFFNEEEKLTSPVLRATLFSSSFDRWRRTQYRAPLYLPSEARLVAPLSVKRITPQAVAAHKEAGYDYVHHLVCHDLGEHPSGEAFRKATESRLKHNPEEGKRAFWLNADEPKFQPRIDFDPDTDITTVSVCSIVYGVTREDAQKLIGRARPLNWAKSRGGFFKSIEGGHLVGEHFQEAKSVDQTRPYEIREHVEWNWGPQLESTGSMINVLEIDDQTARKDLSDEEAARRYVQRVFDRAYPDLTQADRTRTASDYLTSPVTDVPKIDYTYRLVRCQQSKFLSSWVSGGLDVDDGRYMAIWRPHKNSERGAFLTTVQKQIHYSKAAEREAFPQFSQLLNLLAPAVITMLLKELAFNSTVTFINDLRNAKRAASHQAPGEN
jgi:hypothetical protein